MPSRTVLGRMPEGVVKEEPAPPEPAPPEWPAGAVLKTEESPPEMPAGAVWSNLEPATSEREGPRSKGQRTRRDLVSRKSVRTTSHRRRAPIGFYSRLLAEDLVYE